MRNVLLTLFLALAVFFGSTHAYAFEQQHRDAHAETGPSAAHADEHDSGSDEDSDAQGQDVAHSHIAMDAVPDPRDAGERFSRTATVRVILDVMALPSLGIPPPLEPPLA